MAARWGGKAIAAILALWLVPAGGLAHAGSRHADPVTVQARSQVQPSETLTTRVARQPAPVRAFVKRRLECNHWGGEEPYSKTRARQIGRAAQRLGCDTLDNDEARLRKRYRGNAELPVILDAVRDAWAL